jgi:hypothetical protein
MKKKRFISLGIVTVLLVIIVIAVSANIGFLTSDGFWGRIDDGYDGVRCDVVGVVAEDPGEFWGTGTKTTQNDTLIRNANVCTGTSYGDGTLSEWTGIDGAVYTNLGSHTITVDYNVCPYYGIFISEYIEGESGGIDAIEIYNNMGYDIVFEDWAFWIEIYESGNDFATGFIELTGTIEAGTTYVVARENITGVAEDLIASALSFSGDDAIVLARNFLEDNDGEQDGAEENHWSSGPTDASPNGTTNLIIGNEPIVQLQNSLDWNQVRYGDGVGGTGFAFQSGLAFRGTDNTEIYGDEVPFLVGKFCHINHPIYADNEFHFSPLTLDLYNMTCGDTSVPPYPPPRLTFMYPVFLDETPNSGDLEDCTYPSTAICADAVTFEQSDSRFRCYYQGDVFVSYTVSLLGFMHLDSETGTCETVEFDPEAADGIFISNEDATNCGCLFAMVTEAAPTAVELKSFEALTTDEGIELVWETASEINNLGFNLYRATSPYGKKTQINDELIESQSPGGTAGAIYSFMDSDMLGVEEFFYWLEDVEMDSAIRFSMYGPVVGISREKPNFSQIFIPLLTWPEITISQ